MTSSPLVIWILAAVVVAFLAYLQKRKVSFGLRVAVAMVLGLLFGALLGQDAGQVSVIGQIYVNFIRMLVMPLLFASITASFARLSDPTQLGKLSAKTIGIFLVTTAVAAAVGLVVALAFDPAEGVSLEPPAGYSAREIPPFTQVILDLMPTNPVSDMANGRVVPVIIFAIFVGAAISIQGARDPESVKAFRDAIQSFNQVMFGVAKLAIRTTPYGVFGLITAMAARYGLSSLLPLGKAIVALYVACAIHMFVVYSGLLSVFARVNPVRFFKKAIPTMAVAFSTRSSYATLPVNLQVITKRMKVSERVAGFVAPLGATMNFDGCGGIWPALVAVFVARIYDIPLGLPEYLILIGTATIGSIGVAGVPGPASIATTVVLTGLGLPLEGMALLLGIDAVVDMGRTAVNATGTTVSAVLVGVWEGEFDREAFNTEEDDALELDPVAA